MQNQGLLSFQQQKSRNQSLYSRQPTKKTVVQPCSHYRRPTPSMKQKFDCRIYGFRKFIILILIMEIAQQYIKGGFSQQQQNTKLLAAIKYQNISVNLLDFLGHEQFIRLIVLSSQFARVLQSHPSVQIKLLMEKKKFFQLRQFKRKIPLCLRLDFQMYNPLNLPPYQSQIQPNGFAFTIMQKPKTHIKLPQSYNRKMKAAFKDKSQPALKDEIVQMKQKNQDANEKKPEVFDQAVIQNARKFYELNQMVKYMVIEQFPKSKNYEEDIRNAKFIQKLLTEEDLINYSKEKAGDQQKMTQVAHVACALKKNSLGRDQSWSNKIKKQQMAGNCQNSSISDLLSPVYTFSKKMKKAFTSLF